MAGRPKHTPTLVGGCGCDRYPECDHKRCATCGGVFEDRPGGHARSCQDCRDVAQTLRYMLYGNRTRAARRAARRATAG